jgi:anti-anti-sigma factor
VRRCPLMNTGHRLHEAQIDHAGVEPAGAFAVEACPSPDGVALIRLAGELDIAATSEVRAHVDGAAGRRGVVLDLSGATFVDSSMLKELLRASAELERDGTQLVLAGIPPAVRRVLDLTRTGELFRLADDRDAALALFGRR